MNYKKLALGVSILVLICFAMVVTCESGYFKGKKVVNSNDDLHKIVQDKINKIAAADSSETKIKQRIDTVKVEVEKVVTKYKTVFKTIYAIAPDTCKPLLDSLNKEHEKVVSIKDQLLFKKDSLLNSHKSKDQMYKDMIILKDYSLSRSHDTIVGLNEELKLKDKDITRTRIQGTLKTILSSAASAILGYGAGKLIP